MGSGQPEQISNEPQVHQRPPRRVLVVDDSALQRRILAKMLVNWGFEVSEAASGEAALVQCNVSPPDMIVSDWMMPGMTGIDFCRQFRATLQENYTYFILLTSKSEKGEIALGLDSGADDFLIKPVDRNELRARITAGERIVDMQRELSEKNRLVNITLEELRRIYDVLDKDLIEAKQLQHSLLPELHHVLAEGALSFILRSAGHVGGDLVGFFPTDDGKLGLFALDVSGHGISSALMTARLAGNLSSVALDQNVALVKQPEGTYFARPPAEVAAAINDLVLNEMETEHYLTLALAYIDLKTGEGTLVQAGHPHPVIQHADGSIEDIGAGGFPVGLLQDMDFAQTSFVLRPGDRLFIMSDGVVECQNPAQDMLEDAGFRRILGNLRDLRGPAVFDAMMGELIDFAETEDFADDVSGILFEYNGSAA